MIMKMLTAGWTDALPPVVKFHNAAAASAATPMDPGMIAQARIIVRLRLLRYALISGVASGFITGVASGFITGVASLALREAASRFGCLRCPAPASYSGGSLSLGWDPRLCRSVLAPESGV